MMNRFYRLTALLVAATLAAGPLRAEYYAPANQGAFPNLPSVDGNGVMHFLVQGLPFKVPGVVADPPMVARQGSVPGAVVGNGQVGTSGSPSGSQVQVSSLTFTPANLATGAAITGGGAVPVSLTVPNASGDQSLSLLTTPYNPSVAGSTTFHVVPNVSALGAIHAGVVLNNSATPGTVAEIGFGNGGDYFHFAPATQFRQYTTYSTYVGSGPNVGDFQSYVNNQPSFLKILSDGTTLSWWVSSTGGVNDWSLVNTPLSIASLGSPNQIGIYVDPNISTAAAGTQGIQLTEVISTASVNPQDAVSYNAGGATVVASGMGAAGGTNPSSNYTKAPGIMNAAYAGNGPGQNELFDTFVGPPNSDAEHVFTGENNLSDMDDMNYDLLANNYHAVNPQGIAANKAVSVPGIFAGVSLANAAAGDTPWPNNGQGGSTTETPNQSYAIQADRLFAATKTQTDLYVRFDWEENGGMKWYWPGNEANGKAQFHNHSSVFRARFAANKAANGGVGPNLHIVFCPLFSGSDFTEDAPPDSDWDVLGNDIYVAHNFGFPDDPFGSFQWALTHGPNSMQQMEAYALAHGHTLALPEYGVSDDNYGIYLYLLDQHQQAWNAAHPNNQYVYNALWFSYAGGYFGQIGNSTMPETAAWYKHIHNPAKYPVEPLPYPVGISIQSGDGRNTISAIAVPANNTNLTVTGYNYYKSAYPGQENINTPTGSGSTPNFVDVSANGVNACYREASVASNGQVGFLTPEVCATPVAAYAGALPANYAAASTASAITTANSTVDAYSGAHMTTAAYTILTTAQNGFLIGFPNAAGLSMDANNVLHVTSKDYYSNLFQGASTVPVQFQGNNPTWVQAVWDFGTFGPANATVTLYTAPYTGGTARPAASAFKPLGAQITGQNHNGANVGNNATEPFQVGIGAGQKIYDAYATLGTAEVLDAQFDAESTVPFTDSYLNQWAFASGASMAGSAGSRGALNVPAPTIPVAAQPAPSGAHEATFGSAGVISTSATPAMIPSGSATDVVFTATVAPVAADYTTGDAQFIGKWGDAQYRSTLFELSGGYLLAAWTDGSTYSIVKSSVPVTVNPGVFVTYEAHVNYVTGVVAFWQTTVPGGVRSQIGGAVKDKSGITPASNSNGWFTLANFNGGTNGFQGSMSAASETIGGVLVLNPVMTATGVTDSTGVVWANNGYVGFQ